MPGETDQTLSEEAKDRGTAIHLLLEHLEHRPRSDWGAMAQSLLPDLLEDERDALLADARRVLDSPAFKGLQGPSAMTEVPFSTVIQELPDHRLIGTIDRLIVEDRDILAVDFKTNRLVPASPKEAPEGLLRQMGAYRAALLTLFPGRNVRTAILWTQTALLMELPNDLTEAALGRVSVG